MLTPDEIDQINQSAGVDAAPNSQSATQTQTASDQGQTQDSLGNAPAMNPSDTTPDTGNDAAPQTTPDASGGGLSPAQIQAISQAAGVAPPTQTNGTSTNSSSPPPSAAQDPAQTWAQMLHARDQYQAQQQQNAPQPSMLDNLVSGIKNYVGSVGQGISQGAAPGASALGQDVQNIQQGKAQGQGFGSSVAQNALPTAADASQAVSGGIIGGLGAANAPFTGIEGDVANALNPVQTGIKALETLLPSSVMSAVGDNLDPPQLQAARQQTVQDAVNEWKSLSPETQQNLGNIAKLLGGAATITGTIMGAGEAPELLGAAKTALGGLGAEAGSALDTASTAMANATKESPVGDMVGTSTKAKNADVNAVKAMISAPTTGAAGDASINAGDVTRPSKTWLGGQAADIVDQSAGIDRASALIAQDPKAVALAKANNDVELKPLVMKQVNAMGRDLSPDLQKIPIGKDVNDQLIKGQQDLIEAQKNDDAIAALPSRTRNALNRSFGLFVDKVTTPPLEDASGAVTPKTLDDYWKGSKSWNDAVDSDTKKLPRPPSQGGDPVTWGKHKMWQQQYSLMKTIRESAADAEGMAPQVKQKYQNMRDLYEAIGNIKPKIQTEATPGAVGRFAEGALGAVIKHPIETAAGGYLADKAYNFLTGK